MVKAPEALDKRVRGSSSALQASKEDILQTCSLYQGFAVTDSPNFSTGKPESLQKSHTLSNLDKDENYNFSLKIPLSRTLNLKKKKRTEKQEQRRIDRMYKRIKKTTNKE